MSHTIAFDTLKYAKKLQAAGVPEPQAEVQAEAMKEQAEAIQELIDDSLATKHDLKQTEERLTNRINEMSYKLTIRMGGMLVTAVIVQSVVIGILAFLLKS